MDSATRPAISACIVARDEEDRLPACLDSLAFCDEILVVDSHSRDRTRELAAARGARVVERDWPGHVAQKEFAIRTARHDWVLCLDADERVSPALAGEIARLRDAGFDGCAGYAFPRLSRYLGREIRHGTWYPDWKLRLFDRRRGRWGGRDPHDRVEVEGATRRLASDLLHEPYRDFAEHLATIDRYTTLMAEQLFADGRRAHAHDLLLRPPLRFLDFYLWRRGCLDGWRGFLLAGLTAHYAWMKYAKLFARARA